MRELGMLEGEGGRWSNYM